VAEAITAIRQGMAVFDSEGKRIGTVVEVRPNAPASAGDAGMGSAVPQPDAAGGARILATGGLGGKDRGEPTDTDLAAQRGDVHSVSGTSQGTYPTAGADDLLRGYGPPRSGAADAGINVSSTVRTGNLGAPGSTGGTSSVESSTERDRGSTDVGASGYVMVSADQAPEVSPAGLHVPFEAVREVASDGRVILDCSAAECVNLYGDGHLKRRPQDQSGLV
jgi:hypothetical protein